MSGTEPRSLESDAGGFPQLRKDPIVDRWVLIAPERGHRPTELAGPARLEHSRACPFCEGQERETPPEIYALRRPGTRPDTPGWRIRVVPNRYPAARVDAPTPPMHEGPGAVLPGLGRHEVVIESPAHVVSSGGFSEAHWADLLGVYLQRLGELRQDDRLRYVQIFKNQGAPAGASLEHAHAQILGLSRVPREIQAELDACQDHCPFCEWLAWEEREGTRLVWQGETLVGITAYAGRFPFETWLLPRRHAAHFDALNAAEQAELARAMSWLLARLESASPGVPYNYFLHTAPTRAPDDPRFHWHWEFLPRVTGIAGFELATGYFLNPVSPEWAAARLRAAD